MKRLFTCFLLLAITVFNLPADESDVILRAQHDAVEDGQNYPAFWWGVGGIATTVLPVLSTAFFADALPVDARRAVALTAPVLGGIGLALIGYSAGKAEVPDGRLTEIKDEYDDPGLASLYKSEYEKTLTRIQRRKRGNAALIGFGLSVGVTGLGFLAVVLTK